MKKLVLLGSVSACLLLSGVASATHRNWLMKESSAACQFATPVAGDVLGVMGEMYNSTSGSRTAICPVSIANRWGSSGTTAFQPNYWSEAIFAAVDFLREGAGAGRTVNCYAAMQAHDGSKYYSTTVSNTGDLGLARITLASPNQSASESQWVFDSTHTLEQNDALPPTSLDYVCSVPYHTAVLAHRFRPCEYTPDCMGLPSESPDPAPDTNPPLNGTTGAKWNNVTVSGIECSPAGLTSQVSSITRSENGIKNTAANGVDVFCPITPPTDDTNEFYRYYTFPRVRYSGGSTASNCVSAGTCPSCRLYWYGRDGLQHNTGLFTKDPNTTPEVLIAAANMGLGPELAFGFMCTLPQNVTLEGASVQVTWSGTADGGT